MYLSHLLIDVGNNPDRPRPGRSWLRNVYRVHQRLCMAFPPEQRTMNDPDFLAPYDSQEFAAQQVHVERSTHAGFLFRIDPQSAGRVVILVQSGTCPDWDYAFHNARHLLAAPPESKLFDPTFAAQQHLRFRLAANPTRKIDTKSGPDGRRRNGKRVPVSNERLYDWLARRAEAAGFSVEPDSISVQPGYVYLNKERNGPGQCLRSARYEGMLIVTEPSRFTETLLRGIGPGKAFGFGLLSVALSPGTWG
jgi:CRISPR system Cascade subunit CasE